MLHVGLRVFIEGLGTLGVASAVEISSSWKDLTDRATITMPRSLKLKNGDLPDHIRRGARVEIALGYYPNILTVFTGYVSALSSGEPFVISCEDGMWPLKQNTLKHTFTNASLAQVVAAIAPGVPVNVLDAQVGELRVNNVSIVKVLDYLKEHYGFYSYFLEDTLYVGFAYQHEARTLVFDMQRNVAENALEYKRKEDIRIKVRATSILPTGKKIQVEVGDPEGEQRTLHYYNIGEAELRRRAEQDISRLQYDGYRGSFTAFGAPRVRHGDNVTIIDPSYPEREGTYRVDRVTTTFSVSGGLRQNIELGPGIDAEAA